MNSYYKIGLAIIFVLVFSICASAQTGVAINSTGAAADTDAILDITSSTKGVLLPRVANHTSLTPDSGSDLGLVVYNTTTKTYWFWDGNEWQELQTTLGGNVGYIQNQVASTQTIGNFRISGEGIMGNAYVGNNIGVGTETPDRRLKITGTGSAGNFNNVYYAPDASRNLIDMKSIK